MKKILGFMMVLSVLLLTGCNFLPDLQPSTQEVDYLNFIEISTAEELKNIEMNKSYQLIADIDLSGEEWIPLGTLSQPFLGHFNGNNHTISNFVITENHSFNGLFGYLEGDVYNLNIIGFDFQISDDFIINAGGLAGMSLGSIHHVSVDGQMTLSANGFNVYAGLLIGNQQKLAQKTIVSGEFKPNEVYLNQAIGTIKVLDSEIAYVGGLLGKSHNTKTYQNEVLDTSISVISQVSSLVGGLIGQQFLYGFEQENPSLSIDYLLVYENIVDISFDFDETDVLSLGGLIGYSQNTDVSNNFVRLNTQLTGGEYLMGTLVGDYWLKVASDNLVYIESMNIDDDTLGVSGSIVGNIQESQEDDFSSYIVASSSIMFDDNLANLITLSQATNIDFYQSNYPNLQDTFIDRLMEILFE